MLHVWVVIWSYKELKENNHESIASRILDASELSCFTSFMYKYWLVYVSSYDKNNNTTFTIFSKYQEYIQAIKINFVDACTRRHVNMTLAMLYIRQSKYFSQLLDNTVSGVSICPGYSLTPSKMSFKTLFLPQKIIDYHNRIQQTQSTVKPWSPLALGKHLHPHGLD